MKPCLVSCCLVFAACEGVATNATPVVNQFHHASQSALTLADGGQCNITIDPASELLIRDLSVVNDPLRTVWSGSTATPSDGAWTFGRLMTAMAGSNDPELFVRNWLAQWDTTRTINGFSVASRTMNAAVTAPWLAASGGTKLDLTRAPFRLLAIVNRMDLKDLPNGSAGEGRFVFGVLDPSGAPLQFTVILEYRLPATTTADIERWASEWHALSAMPIGSPQFNQALETLTARFAGPNAAPTRINGSAINQVRTNEIALTAPWEMREFTLAPSGQLVEGTVAQTTDLSLNNSPALASFINGNTASLLAGTHVVPATFNTASFRAGSALTPIGHFWAAPGITNNEARFNFSVNTCNGCHAGETGTTFLHISPRAFNAPAQLSGFLTGTNVPDPVSRASRTFNDLATRTLSLASILCSNAPSVSIVSPAAGDTVRGQVTLSATATNVSSVDFRIDGAPVRPPLTTAPFSFSFDVGTLPFGPHTLTAIGLSSTGTPLVTSAPVAFVSAPTSAPDFTITRLAAPNATLSGARFSADVLVCNQGNLAGVTAIDLVQSSDATIGFDDRSIGRGPTVSLTPGQCATQTIQGTASLGASFIGAIADVPKVVVELNENNNASAAATMGVGSGPDFTASWRSVPLSALPGSTFSTVVNVCNRGTLPGSTSVDLVLSADTTIALPQDARVGSAVSPVINAGSCTTVTISGIASPPAPGTLFSLAAVVDAPSAVNELIETNNVSPLSVFAIGSGPDFTAPLVSVPASALPGAAFTTSVQVCNRGTTTGSTQVDLVLSADKTLSPVTPPGPTDDRVLSTQLVSLTANQCQVLSMNGAAPLAGQFFVGVVLDSARAVVELNENNNLQVSNGSIAIGNAPDFVIGSVSAPSTAQPGSTFTAQVGACNRGTVAGTVHVDLLLSVDAVFALATPTAPSTDVVVGGANFSLAVGQCTSQSVTVEARPPSNGSSTGFLLGAVADLPNTVPELLETNNTSSGSSIAIGTAPDFVITTTTVLSVPTATEPAKPVTLSVRVCNQGFSSGAASVDLLQSIDNRLDATDRTLFSTQVDALGSHHARPGLHRRRGRRPVRRRARAHRKQQQRHEYQRALSNNAS